MLDRVQQGRRYILVGTLLARGLLCWGMAGAVLAQRRGDPAAGRVRRAGAAEGVRGDPQRGHPPAAAGRDHAGDRERPDGAGLADRHHPRGRARGRGRRPGRRRAGGAAWVLRVGTLGVPGRDGAWASGCRAGSTRRMPQAAPRPPVKPARTRPAWPVPGRHPPAGRAALLHPRRRLGRPAGGTPRAGAAAEPERGGGTLRQLGPVVAEAMGANATLRAFSGFMIFFLAFLLRTVHFGSTDKVALGEMIARGRRRRVPRHGDRRGAAVRGARRSSCSACCGLATVVTALLRGVLRPVGGAGRGPRRRVRPGAVKLALDSIVQHEIGEDIRLVHLRRLGDPAPAVLGGRRPRRAGHVADASGVAGLTVAAAGLGVSFALLCAPAPPDPGGTETAAQAAREQHGSRPRAAR